MLARNLPGLITHDTELFLGDDLCVSCDELFLGDDLCVSCDELFLGDDLCVSCDELFLGDDLCVSCDELFLGDDLCVSCDELFLRTDLCVSSDELFFGAELSVSCDELFLRADICVSGVFQLVRTWRTRLSVRNAEPTPGPDTSTQAPPHADVSFIKTLQPCSRIMGSIATRDGVHIRLEPQR